MFSIRKNNDKGEAILSTMGCFFARKRASFHPSILNLLGLWILQVKESLI
jgi:hypothetical protein